VAATQSNKLFTLELSNDYDWAKDRPPL